MGDNVKLLIFCSLVPRPLVPRSNALHWNANFEALPQTKGGGASINIISR
ncbi:hypothetical protein PL9631_520099 [Planktothrix paucivesiculata PCC 9631]|uniref:Uncharacterized protein n=1 Tax=Planktothrix paucivesiculata PCC 9631 TaxID=671071 RepID=A0A7Z9BRC1_9CYAN|nr:hypothetical protein PL9631_520099 [Planktothrix paucivesiculata PCC 9631]